MLHSALIHIRVWRYIWVGRDIRVGRYISLEFLALSVLCSQDLYCSGWTLGVFIVIAAFI